MGMRTPKQPPDRAAGGPAPGDGFTLEDVKELVQLVEGSDVTHLAWRRAGEKVVIRLGGAAPTPTPAAAPFAPVTAPVPPGPAHAAGAAPRAEPRPELPGVVVTSPFVGTFYRSPSPEAPVFVEVGQRVKKGQPLCIVEAMKLMNEIECEVDGTVAEILVQSGTAVEYGEALFRILPG
jgi:acetyl-CoA carboxylase biotin carboxyl carrier protein